MLKFPRIFSGLSEFGQRVKIPLPLLIVFLLPFYSIPGSIEAIRLAQVQYFQLATVIAAVFAAQRLPGSSIWHPMKWFIVMALSQLIFHNVHGRMIFFIQMLAIIYVFFEITVRTKIRFIHFQKVICIFLAATSIYALAQYFDSPHLVKPAAIEFLTNVIPKYLMTDFNRITGQLYVSGIWYKQAYLGIFCAMCIPIFIVMKTRLKWVLICICLLLAHQTNSSAALGAALIGFLWWAWFRKRRFFKVSIAPSVLLFLVWYVFNSGNFSSENSRLQVWKMTLDHALNADFFGESLGSFFHFGLQNTLMQIEPKGVFYAEAHNALLQMYFEAGIPGVFITLWLIGWVIFYGFKYNKLDSILGLSGALLVLIATSFIQPTFYVIHLGSIAVLMLAMMEQRRIKMEGK